MFKKSILILIIIVLAGSVFFAGPVFAKEIVGYSNLVSQAHWNMMFDIYEEATKPYYIYSFYPSEEYQYSTNYQGNRSFVLAEFPRDTLVSLRYYTKTEYGNNSFKLVDNYLPSGYSWPIYIGFNYETKKHVRINYDSSVDVIIIESSSPLLGLYPAHHSSSKNDSFGSALINLNSAYGDSYNYRIADYSVNYGYKGLMHNFPFGQNPAVIMPTGKVLILNNKNYGESIYEPKDIYIEYDNWREANFYMYNETRSVLIKTNLDIDSGSATFSKDLIPYAFFDDGLNYFAIEGIGYDNEYHRLEFPVYYLVRESSAGPPLDPGTTDPSFMIDDYIVVPVDIPLSSSENIFTVKYVVKAPGTIDNFETPYIFTTSDKTTETFRAGDPYNVIQYDSDHVGFYVDTTIRLKPNSLNNFTIRVKKNSAVGFTLAQAKYVINSSFIPGSDVEVYDPDTGAIDTDLTVRSALKTLLDFVSDLGDYLNSMAIIFTWLPPQIYALIVVALTLGIILRVVGRS